jgi:putative ABC transport system permease protein
MFQDLRFGFRMLRRQPGFSLLAILCLTLGIGANAAIFSWIEGIILRPYPLVVDSDRLLVLAGTLRGDAQPQELSYPDFEDLRDRCKLFDAFIAEKITGTTLSIGDRAERTPGSMVSANYFDAMGIRPVLGRAFSPSDDVGRNAHPVTVISYQVWQERFRGDPQIIGKTQILNGLPYTIVGVAPKGFYGTFVGWAFQFWVPISMQQQFNGGNYALEDRNARFIEGFVRLKPGVTREQAQAEISAAAQRLETDFPETNRGRGIQLIPVWRGTFNNGKVLLPTLRIGLVVVAAVLLIACANVSNLLLVRALARRQEMTVRLAMGAGRARLTRQLLAEGLILATISAAAGLLLAYWCRNALVVFFPPRGGVRLHLTGEMDARVLVLSAGVCVLATLLVALAPAILTSRVDLAGTLRAEAGAILGGGGRSSIRSALVLLQISLSCVLLVGALLLVRSLREIRNASTGFSTEGVLTTWLDLFTAGYDRQRVMSFEDALAERVRSLGGVESVAFSWLTPFGFQVYPTAPIAVEGYVPAPDEQPAASFNRVGAEYFATLGIPLVSGREFTRADDDNAAPVAIVDETMAAQYFGSRDPVGQRLKVKDQWTRIVGVARNSKYQGLLETAKPFVYLPLRQGAATGVSVHIRTKESAASMRPKLVREIQALNPGLAPAELITMREQVDRTTASQRSAVTLLSIFGTLALLLAAVGLYGVMSTVVSQSERELGLRMALGASASDLLRLVLSRALLLTIGGILLGAALAFKLTGLMGYLLYKVNPRDLATFGKAIGVIGVASVTACLLPAWRAVRIDPLRALKD